MRACGRRTVMLRVSSVPAGRSVSSSTCEANIVADHRVVGDVDALQHRADRVGFAWFDTV